MAEQKVVISYKSPDPPVHVDDNLYTLRVLGIWHYIWGSLFLVTCTIGLLLKEDPASDLKSRIDLLSLWFGALLGPLTVYSGWCLRARRMRVLSLIVASLNCLIIPLGSILGIWTIVTIHRASQDGLYSMIRATTITEPSKRPTNPSRQSAG